MLPDDDISGTFAFFRALEDNGYPRTSTPQAVGKTWLNYIIEEKTILWWGGLGRSTEHTAFLHLKNGIDAPLSGSHQLNGPWIPAQIGAQIFMDGFAMAAPDDPDRAAHLVRAAASVSHDGIALDAARAARHDGGDGVLGANVDTPARCRASNTSATISLLQRHRRVSATSAPRPTTGTRCAPGSPPIMAMPTMMAPATWCRTIRSC